MPSGAKTRRPVQRKKLEEAHTKQTDELTTVSIVKLSIPIEELAKGAILHEAASVDKELEESNQSIGEVADKTKVATVDDNAIKENEFPLLNSISNEDNVVSNDVPVVSQNADCTTEIKESGENLKEKEESDDTKETEITTLLVPGVFVSNDSKETELLTGKPEDIVEKDDDSLFYSMSPDEMLEKYHDLLSETDTSILDYDKNRGFFLREAEIPVVVSQPTLNEDVKEISPNSPENTVLSSAEIMIDSKETQVVSTISVSPATDNQAHFTSPVPCNPEGIVTMDDLLSIFTMSPEEIWEKYLDKNREFFLREAELPVVVAQPTSNEDVEETTPKSAENAVCSSIETTSECKETQAVSIITVSPATENQPCNPECTALKESIENLMARVRELESSMHTFKEDLQKTLDKLNANSF